jgi:hypothetical protein
MKSLILVLLLFGFSSFAKSTDKTLTDKTLIDCQNNGDDAGLESLTIVQSPDSTMKAIVLMSLQDSYETYTYPVNFVPPAPRRMGAPLIYSATKGKFELAVCSTCAPVNKQGDHSGSVTFTSAKKAKLYPAMKLKYQSLACKLN